MSKRAENLARELVRLSIRYSSSEFDEAVALIGNGELFASIRRAATAVGAKKRPRSAMAHSPSLIDVDRQVRASVLSLVSELPQDEQEELLHFLNLIERGAVLPNIRAIRSVFGVLELPPPKGGARRADMLFSLFAGLVRLERSVREAALTSFSQSALVESSLKRWSDLIVKNREE